MANIDLKRTTLADLEKGKFGICANGNIFVRTGTCGEIPPVVSDQFVELEDVPNIYTGYAGDILKVNITEDGISFLALDPIKNTFVKLNDTPITYTLNEYKYMRVNSAGTGLEFIDKPIYKDNFIELNDTPANYTGQDGNILVVNATEDSLELIPKPILKDTFLELDDTPIDYASKAGQVAVVNLIEDGLTFDDTFKKKMTDEVGAVVLATGFSVDKVYLNNTAPKIYLDITNVNSIPGTKIIVYHTYSSEALIIDKLGNPILGLEYIGGSYIDGVENIIEIIWYSYDYITVEISQKNN